MRFLLDQDVYAGLARFLRDHGHDVLRVGQVGLAAASDEALLSFAHEQRRIMITRDRDFGALVFVRGMPAGVIYLRVSPSTEPEVHRELLVVLERYSERELARAFTVVQPGRHRFRRLPGGSEGA